MTSDRNQFEELFPEAYRNFEVEQLFADLPKSLKKDHIKAALLGKLCHYSREETAKKIGFALGTITRDLSDTVYPAIEQLLQLENEIDWKKADLFQLLEKYKKSFKDSLSVNIPWKQVCFEVLKKQQKQWLTSYPLGSGAREIPEMYVPLELVEREEKPRVPLELDPEKWSTREQEKREQEKPTPISNQEFLDQVFQGKSPKSKGKRIAVIGEPGAGKTTLLQKIASEVKELPIWIDLADIGAEKHQSLEDYLLETWLSRWALRTIRKLCPEASPSLLTATEELKNALVEEFEQGHVCLLLDGADEMAAKFGQPLIWIEQKLRGSWIADAKVILSCRLNLWSIEGDYLLNFDVYRNVDFNDEQVEEFIEKWFATEPDSCKKLKEERNLANERIKSLIRNPLRLTLLCLTWKKGGKELPDTKAGLYQRLVEGHYNWKREREGFALSPEEQKKLNQWLGELAKDALDSKESRFRLRKSFIESFLAEHNQDSSLWELAIKLGWLIEIGLPSEDEKDADEPVYAFFHPTFQEYFAALAIDDWEFFLASEHIDRPVKDTNCRNKYKPYRIFEAHWKEVILIWFGRKEENFWQKKEEFIKALVNFKDGCSNFYGFQAYFLATSCIEEFWNCSRTDEIVAQIIKWSFGYSNNSSQEKRVKLPEPILEGAMAVLPEMARSKAISVLIHLLETAEDENERILIYEPLTRFGSGDRQVIDVFVKMLNTTEEESTLFNAAFCLDRISPGNPHITTALVKYLDKNKSKNANIDDELCRDIVTNKLREIELSNLSKSDEPDNTSSKDKNHNILKNIAEVSWQIKLDDPQASNRLIEILNQADDENTSYIASELLLLVNPNHEKAIKTLIALVEKAKDISIQQLAIQSLRKSAIGNEQAIIFLFSKVREFTNKKFDIRRLVYTDIVWQCAQNMSYPDFYDAWHKPTTTHREVPENIPVGKSSITQNLNFTQLPSILDSKISKDEELNKAVKLICIDINNEFSNPNMLAVYIYRQMVKQGCPKCSHESPTNMPLLSIYWDLDLGKLEKRVALLFYNSKNDRTLNPSFLSDISTFGGTIAIISDRHCENVRLISPNDPNLIDTVLKWLKREFSEF